MKHVTITQYPQPNIEVAWYKFLESAPFASHYTCPALFLEPRFRTANPFAVLAINDDGKSVIGVLTGTRRGARIECGASFSPQLCLGATGDSEKIVHTLVSGLLESVAQRGDLVSVYSWAPIDVLAKCGFSVSTFSGSNGIVTLDLNKGAAQLFKEFSETSRNQIRKAQRAGVCVTELNLATEFDKYYEIYSDWCAFKKLPATPYELQRAIFETTGNRLVLVAKHCGKTIGVSTFRYSKPGIVEYAANVSRREDTQFRQNDLLLWSGIQWAAEQNSIETFSMGGAHFYLQKFGGTIHETYGYRLDTSLFKIHDLTATGRSFASKLFRLLPAPTRAKLKSVLGR